MSSRSSPWSPAARRRSRAVCFGVSRRRSCLYQSAILTPPPYRPQTDGVAKCEHFNVAANGSLAHSQLCRQVWDGLLSPLAEQVQYQLSPLRRAHGLTPLSLPCPDSTG